MSYHISKTVDMSFVDAVSKVTEELKKEGFGILTEIDVQATLKKKLDVDFRKYVILGSCNPPFAYEALTREDKVGILLPCNVVVQEHGAGKVEISAVDPLTAMEVAQNPNLQDLGEQVHKKLESVIDAV
jgi:uncharacterized protein (DUF302 family)